MLTVVTGPPCSGKTTYVAEYAQPGDVVIDFDNLAQALGSPTRHGHADDLRYITRMARTAAISAAIQCHKRGSRVWIVDCDPPKQRRQQYHIAGAQWVRLMVDPVELHRRADAERPDLWHSLIDQWLAKRSVTQGEVTQGVGRW